MYQQFRNRADFLTIYIREAHPIDEWQMDVNVKEAVCHRQPRTMADRVAIADDFVRRFHYPIPLVVDPMGNDGERLYGAWPKRLYIITPDHKIVYKGGVGPFTFKQR